ncbi:MAG: class I SAM-dependent methyltransferase [Actinobacteria bacterium]|nr:class I SAM-dependent methyltransferase [Actinomycetota bacterium]
MSETLKEKVRQYWEQEPCGSSQQITGASDKGSIEWFKRIEEYRYNVEPFIHSVAKFTRHHGEKVLEVGVGSGTDHLQWARAGAECYGVDLTDAAIETTRAHLSIYGFKSNLQRIDAEELPFDDESFDIVYSWGVIHHTENPERIIREIKRVLKKEGVFIGMMYGRRSVLAFKLWLKHALLKGRPWRSFADVIWHHMESVGTKAYTVSELKELFSGFSDFSAKPLITPYDTSKWPGWLSKYFPDKWGWFIALEARK